MKLKNPNPGNGKCDAYRCKQPPEERHQLPDGTIVELCTKHGAEAQAEYAELEYKGVEVHPIPVLVPAVNAIVQGSVVDQAIEAQDVPGDWPAVARKDTSPVLVKKTGGDNFRTSSDLPAPEILEPAALETVKETATELATLTQASFVGALANEAKEQAEILELVQDFEIKDQAAFTFLEDVLRETQASWKDHEARRTSFSKPANGILREFNGWFKPTLTALKSIESTVKSKLSTYRMTQLQEQQRLIQVARTQAEPEAIKGNLIKAAEAPPETQTSYIDRWLFVVEKPQDLPREFLMPDLAAIKKVVDALKAKTSIPGVRAYNEPIVRGPTK